MMQILGLLSMYFDAVVVEVKKYLLFFSDWLWPYCGYTRLVTQIFTVLPLIYLSKYINLYASSREGLACLKQI